MLPTTKQIIGRKTKTRQQRASAAMASEDTCICRYLVYSLKVSRRRVATTAVALSRLALISFRVEARRTRYILRMHAGQRLSPTCSTVDVYIRQNSLSRMSRYVIRTISPQVPAHPSTRQLVKHSSRVPAARTTPAIFPVESSSPVEHLRARFLVKHSSRLVQKRPRFYPAALACV